MLPSKGILLFFLVSGLHQVIGSERNERNCVVTNAKNEHWRLKWEESFDGDLEGWKWHQGMKGFVIESHNLKENGFIYENNLVLVAKHSLSDPINPYTGAILTSPVLHPQNFTSPHVRYEIRAALPLGTQIMSSIMAQAVSLEPTACDYKWLVTVTNAQRPVIQATTRVCEKDGDYELAQKKKEHEGLDFTRYQTYGIHWNATHVNLFANEHNTLETPLSDDPPEISDPRKYQLFFVIGLGGRYFYQPLPNDFGALKWICPAMIIDYIRVYEKVSSIEGIPKCEFQDDANADDVLDGICQMARQKSELYSESEGSRSGSDAGLILMMSTVILAGLVVLGYYFKRSGMLENARRGEGIDDTLAVINENINSAFVVE